MSGTKAFIDKGVAHANQAIRFDREACDSDGDAQMYEVGARELQDGHHVLQRRRRV
jgi:hypothetical protein